MATNYSTGYIFGFAAVVCLACSVFVAGSAVFLKERQEVNAAVDRQSKVLSVAGLVRPGEKLDNDAVQARFDEYIVPKVVDLDTGEYVDDVEAATFDMGEAMKDPDRSEAAPQNAAGVLRVPHRGLVYQVVADGTIEKLIIPVEGKGLWGTLYGYFALENDAQTVAGLTFYKHQETPGLGGEVDNPNWKGLWKGRKIYGEEGEPKIAVVKGPAGPASSDPYHVDGLSGATITSRGVTHLLQFWMGDEAYAPYLEKFRDAPKTVDVAKDGGET